MRIIFVFLAGSFMFFSCNVNRNDIPGTYVANSLEQTVDTLRILPNGNYNRTLYSKDGKLIYKNINHWKYVDNDILLSDYLVNEDEKHSPEEVLGAGSELCFFPIKNKFNTIFIYYGYGGPTDSFYKKI